MGFVVKNRWMCQSSKSVVWAEISANEQNVQKVNKLQNIGRSISTAFIVLRQIHTSECCLKYEIQREIT